MTLTPLAALEGELTAARAARKAAHEEREAAFRTPFGAELHRLHQEWGKLKAANDAKIAAQRASYIAQVEDIEAKIAEYRLTHPKPVRDRKRGRPAVEHSDEIKRLAYLASTEHGKNKVRVMLGIGSTEQLNALLAEGKALQGATRPLVTTGYAPEPAAGTDITIDTDNEGGW